MFFVNSYYTYITYDRRKKASNEQRAKSNEQRAETNEQWATTNEQGATSKKFRLLDTKLFFYAGKIMSMSIKQGGAKPTILSKGL